MTLFFAAKTTRLFAVKLLLHDVLCIFYNLPISAAQVLVPIDYNAIQLGGGSSNTQNYGY